MGRRGKAQTSAVRRLTVVAIRRDVEKYCGNWRTPELEIVATATHESGFVHDKYARAAKSPRGTFAALNSDMTARQHLTIRALAVALIAALALLPHSHADKAASAESNATVAANR